MRDVGKAREPSTSGRVQGPGGVNLVSCLGATARCGLDNGLDREPWGVRGFAARLFGVKATICLPEAANAAKVARMRHLGAELVFFGHDFDEAREHCERLAVDVGPATSILATSHY